MSKDFAQSMLKVTKNDLAVLASDGVAQNDVTDYYDSGSYTMNAVLSGSIYGGIPSNKVTAFAGRSGTGKTYLALGAAKHFLDQQPEGYVFCFESEGAITTEDIEKRGIDRTRFAVISVSTVEEFRHQITLMLNNYNEMKEEDKKPLFFILDSLGQLSTSKEVADVESGSDKADFTRAKLIRGTFRVISMKLGRAKAPLVMTNHTYKNIGNMAQEIMSGGEGLYYSADQIVFLGKKKIKEDTDHRGNIVRAKLVKGRLVKEGTNVDSQIDFAKGLRPYYGLVELAIESGVWSKIGNKVKYDGGKTTWQKSIDNNPEKYFTEDVLNAIDEYVQAKFKYAPLDEETGN